MPPHDQGDAEEQSSGADTQPTGTVARPAPPDAPPDQETRGGDEGALAADEGGGDPDEGGSDEDEGDEGGSDPDEGSGGPDEGSGGPDEGGGDPDEGSGGPDEGSGDPDAHDEGADVGDALEDTPFTHDRAEPTRTNAPSERAKQDQKVNEPSAFHVVGLGASAGGLDALRSFLRAMPSDSGMAFVIVAHLAPEHESYLAELLQSHTEMLVEKVIEATALRRNRVYVIPPGRNLATVDGFLRLKTMEPERRARAPIDRFLRTLAKTHRDRSVGIILSGTGSDGTLGIRRIKEEGGLTIAQDPQEAAYDGMPQSAVSTGAVDLVLPIAQMPQALIDFARAAPALQAITEEGVEDGDRALLQRILSQVRVRTGHDFSRYKTSTVMRRIRRRMQLTHVGSLEEYLSSLRIRPDESRALINELLITVTCFFRDERVFEFIEQETIPALFKGKRAGENVRVWSVGCATGEEAYTIAILLLEHASQLRGGGPRVQVFASDLHPAAIETAREGFFLEAIEADISPERLARFFRAERGGYRARQELREAIVFAPHNLLKDPPFTRLDLILCRNVLIYLQRDLHSELAALFHYALVGGGYLVLGTAETINRSDLFRAIKKTHSVLQRRDGQAREPQLMHFPLDAPRSTPGQRRAPISGEPISHERVHHAMLERHGAPSVLIDEEQNIVYFSENIGPFLWQPSGEPTNNLFKRLISPLRVELRAALFTATEHRKRLSTRPVDVPIEGEVRRVVLHVCPAAAHPAELHAEGMSLILFEVLRAPPVEEMGPRSDSTRSLELEAELDQTRHRLRLVVEEYETSQEEMRAANEELQSMNEELRAAMEELETSKEELQSMNEELTTLNQETRHRVEELSQLTNDLQNLLAATEIAILFLDRRLCIQRFNPSITRLFSIQSADRGRPLTDFTHRLNDPDLARDARRVLKRLQIVEREVRSQEGVWYLLRILPYRTTEDRIEGVVITLVEITQFKCAERALRGSEERLRRAIINAPFPILIHAEGGAVLEVSEALLEITGYHREAIETLAGWTERAYGERAPQMRRRISRLYELDKRVDEGELPVTTASGETRIWSFHSAPLGTDERGERLVISMAADVTRLKHTEDRLKGLLDTLEERVEERTQQVRELASRLTRVEQIERERISRILHDDLQQLLYAVQVQVNLIGRILKGDDETLSADESLTRCDRWLAQAIKTTRQLTVDLSPPILRDEGLVEALSWLRSQMAEMYQLDVEVRAPQPIGSISADMRTLLFQVVRELLFNVVRHASTDRAVVTVRRAERDLEVCVEDRGQGFDVHSTRAGSGLTSVEERLRLFDGEVALASTPGEGTSITLRVPLEIALG